jgi:hypothetical protein
MQATWRSRITSDALFNSGCAPVKAAVAPRDLDANFVQTVATVIKERF